MTRRHSLTIKNDAPAEFGMVWNIPIHRRLERRNERQFTMPRFRFEFVGEPDVEPIWVNLFDRRAAQIEARHALADALLDHLERRKSLAIDVYDDAGKRFMTLRMDEGD